MTKKHQQNKALDAALDELIRQEKDPSTILSEDGLLKQLTKRLVERALNAEMDEHLGYSNIVGMIQIIIGMAVQRSS